MVTNVSNQDTDGETDAGDAEAPDSTDVAIVGGGIAGLTAGVALAERDYDVAVLEEKDVLGGRARSWEDPETGDDVHVGPHILLSGYPNLFKLMEHLGTLDQVVWQTKEFITIMDGEEEYVKEQSEWLPAPLSFIPSELEDDRLGVLDRASGLPVIAFALSADEEDFQRLDHVNAYAFLKSAGVSEEMIDAAWRFSTRAIMNVPLEYCSAGALLRFFQRFVGYSDFDVGFPDGGLGDLFVPESRAIIEENGGTVRTDTTVDAIVPDGNAVESLRLASGDELRADHYVSTLPPLALQRLLPREWRKNHEPFRELGYFQPCPYVSVYVWFDREVTDRKFWARAYRFDDLNLDFYDLSNINSGWEDRSSVVTANVIYSGRIGEMSDEAIVEETVAELAENLPAVRDAEVENALVNRIPMAIHCPYPGTEQRRASQRSPVDDLVLAGDWVDTGLPSSMESAAKSGWRAAEIVLERDGRPEELCEPEPELDGIARAVNEVGKLPPLKLSRRLIPPIPGE